MPASLKSIRQNTDIAKTPGDKGLQMTIAVKAYDIGMVTVDDRPINKATRSGRYDPGHGWLGAAEYVVLQLGELGRHAAARQKRARS